MGLFDVVSEEREDKEIIKIIVASWSEKPYFKKKYGMTEKGCFIRVGTAAELMRVYKDLEMVEQLGSGIPRILETYGRECFLFSENFLRMVFPAIVKVTPRVTPQVERLLEVIPTEHSRQELQEKLGLSDREYFRKAFLQPAIEEGLIELTIPGKPKSSKQCYKLTQKGKTVLSQ